MSERRHQPCHSNALLSKSAAGGAPNCGPQRCGCSGVAPERGGRASELPRWLLCWYFPISFVGRPLCMIDTFPNGSCTSRLKNAGTGEITACSVTCSSCVKQPHVQATIKILINPCLLTTVYCCVAVTPRLVAWLEVARARQTPHNLTHFRRLDYWSLVTFEILSAIVRSYSKRFDLIYVTRVVATNHRKCFIVFVSVLMKTIESINEAAPILTRCFHCPYLHYVHLMNLLASMASCSLVTTCRMIKKMMCQLFCITTKEIRTVLGKTSSLELVFHVWR